jgi:hypothetical protein
MRAIAVAERLHRRDRRSRQRHGARRHLEQIAVPVEGNERRRLTGEERILRRAGREGRGVPADLFPLALPELCAEHRREHLTAEAHAEDRHARAQRGLEQPSLRHQERVRLRLVRRHRPPHRHHRAREQGPVTERRGDGLTVVGAHDIDAEAVGHQRRRDGRGRIRVVVLEDEDARHRPRSSCARVPTSSGAGRCRRRCDPAKACARAVSGATIARCRGGWEHRHVHRSPPSARPRWGPTPGRSCPPLPARR